MKLVRSAAELLRIVLFRFRTLPRVWAILLVAVNLGALFFIDTIYGQVALGTVTFAVLVMIAIHMRCGFVRLLGIGHILWIPMLLWMIVKFPSNSERTGLATWVGCLIVCNAISLVVDTIDVWRYWRGDRLPHYEL